MQALSEPFSLRSRNDLLALGVLFLLLCAFLSSPLAKFSTHTYAPTDITQRYLLTRTGDDLLPANPLLSDPVVLIHPALMFNRRELAHGRLPLWNPHNGLGIPHLANYQSSVFSPFSLPFYLLNFKIALLLSAFLKLGGLALFAYLYARLLGLGTAGALATAVLFAFGGYNLLWLAWPHPAAAISLPASLLFTEMGIRRAQHHADWWRSRAGLLPLLGLIAALALGLIAGHPETFYAGFLLLSARILWLVVPAFRQGDILRTLLPLIIAGLLSALLCAPQILPFLEYLSQSDVAEVHHSTRNASNAPIKAAMWPLAAFPDAVGNPSFSSMYDNFNELNGRYAGPLAVVFALLALGIVRSVRSVRFWLAMLGAWILYAYNLGGAATLFEYLPLLSIQPVNRLDIIPLFALAMLGGIICDRFVTGKASCALQIALPVIAVTWVITAALRGQRILDTLLQLRDVQHGQLAHPPESILAQLPSTLALALATCGLLLWASRLALQGESRSFVAPLLAISLFLPTGWMLRDYNPTIPDSLVYPETEWTQLLCAEAQSAPAVIPGPPLTYSNLNLAYNYSELGFYDGIGPRNTLALLRPLFGYHGFPEFWKSPRLSDFGLSLVGAKAVVLRETEKPRVALLDGPSHRAWLISEPRPASSPDESLAQVCAEDFDPSTTAILGPEHFLPLPSALHSGTVECIREHPCDLEFRTKTTAPQWLIWASTFYPGWKATVNGTNIPIARANYAFSAVPVPQGASTVVFRYTPASFRLGCILSLASVLAIAWWCIAINLKRKTS